MRSGRRGAAVCAGGAPSLWNGSDPGESSDSPAITYLLLYVVRLCALTRADPVMRPSRRTRSDPLGPSEKVSWLGAEMFGAKLSHWKPSSAWRQGDAGSHWACAIFKW